MNVNAKRPVVPLINYAPKFAGAVSGRSAANRRENGAMVSVAQEPSLADLFRIQGQLSMAISKVSDSEDTSHTANVDAIETENSYETSNVIS